MNRSTKRLTVVESVHYQDGSGENPPISSTTRFEITVDDSSLPLNARGDVGEDWVPLPRGRITDCSMLCIENLEGKFTQQVPSIDERADADAKVIEIGVGVGNDICGIILVHPGRSVRFCPRDVKMLKMRSRHARAKFTIQVYPK